MKYDDYTWHYGGDFPQDLPPSAGATHIAMFVAWALLNGLAGDLHLNDFPADLERLSARLQSPGSWFIQACDGKFTNEDLNDTGNAFAESYYAGADGLHEGPGSYLADYEAAFPHFSTSYHVPDNWATFDKLKDIIRKRFSEWQGTAAETNH